MYIYQLYNILFVRWPVVDSSALSSKTAYKHCRMDERPHARIVANLYTLMQINTRRHSHIPTYRAYTPHTRTLFKSTQTDAQPNAQPHRTHAGTHARRTPAHPHARPLTHQYQILRHFLCAVTSPHYRLRLATDVCSTFAIYISTPKDRFRE